MQSHEKSVFDVPEEIWEQIISLLDQDPHLQSLSRVSKTFLSITNRLKKTLIISDATSHFLPKLFHRFPNLREISLSDFHGDPSSVLQHISKFNYPLTSLDLSKQRVFPIKFIKQLPVTSLMSLRSLRLHKLSVLNDVVLEVISQLMPNLEELDLSDPKDDFTRDEDEDKDRDKDTDDEDVEMVGGGCVGITDDGVDFLASKVNSLRKVNFSGNYFISDKSIVCLAKNCPNLEEIDVTNCTFVTHMGMRFAFQNCSNLKSVSLLGMDLNVVEISNSIGYAKNLSVLEFSYMSISDGLLFAIAKASIPLSKFGLYECKDFTFSGVLSLLRCYSCLECFSLEGVYWITDRIVIDLSKFLRKAKTVKLNYCWRLTGSSLFTILKNCPSLNELEMEKTDLGREEFAVCNAYNSQVRALKLSLSKSLSNDCLEKIALSCPSLEQLDVSNCPNITRKGIGEIVRNCVLLKDLQICGCGAIKNLGIDAKLRKLEILGASNSGLNDDALITIAKKCPTLVSLNISCCTGVSPGGVKEVVNRCGRLKEINLNWCRLSHDIVPWMVFSSHSLRKIMSPLGFVPTECQKRLFFSHGCLVEANPFKSS